MSGSRRSWRRAARSKGRLERYLFFPNLGDDAQDVFPYTVTRARGVSDDG
ncbi:MAG: hypothetical protein OEO20_12765 [Gemmatimonadota bacterium]|nr:hypothetical protein [Gemmatimonadota bacterium]MDH3369587.1 hypothetical protein [Gemmatimonadota bacterium]MDH3479167.1 hypothetical protein [Gemmatimonadota bacterium]MDH3569681.1 hypothetical protein [Gemmatimonadota bacterium]MDH5550724.1 hypothetical protein [Gemmatimonadota bacterium]